MNKTLEHTNKDRLERAWQALESAQRLQDDRITYRLDHVNLYIEDVEGEWLETWGKEPGESPKKPMNVERWDRSIFEPEWQALEEFFCPEEHCWELVFKTAGVKGVKFVGLGDEAPDRALALVVTIEAQSERQMGVLVQLYSSGDRLSLPDGLKLSLLSPTEEILHEVAAHPSDRALQMEWSGQPPEQIRVRVALEEPSITEEFAI